MFQLKKLHGIGVSKFILGLMLFFSAISSQAQILRFNTSRSRETIVFKFIKNLIIIEVTINDKGPYNFVLDTGVSTFLITDPKLFGELNIKNYRDLKIVGLGEGIDLSAYLAAPVNVKIGTSIEGEMPVAILKDELLDLSGFAGMPIHGLIGYEFFSSFIVRVKYGFNTLTVFKNETTFIPRKGARIPITIEDRKPYLVSEIKINDTTKINAKLIIDTGAGHPVSLETNAGASFEVPPVNIRANLGVGLSGPINGYIARVKSVRLGRFELKNVVAAFPDYNDVAFKVTTVDRNGNIGNEILKHFDAVFDYYHERIYLQPTYVFRQAFEHDMSGLQLESAGDNFERIFIHRIEPGSAADESELGVGDQILTINLKPVSELSLQEIENMFRSQNGRNFLLEVIPANSKKRERVILTLKRRI